LGWIYLDPEALVFENVRGYLLTRTREMDAFASSRSVVKKRKEKSDARTWYPIAASLTNETVRAYRDDLKLGNFFALAIF
jgi:hypothetical protein